MKSPEQRDYDAFARFYDLFYEQRDDDLPMYRDLARGAGGPILELGCGTGRVLVPLALEGHQVTGLDFSTAMLTIAQEKVNAAQVSEQVELVQGDIRDFDLASRFATTIVPLNTFMHCYNIDQQLACLGSVRRHLQPGGRLIIDVYHPDLESLLEADGRLISEGTVLDPSTGHTIHHVYTRLLDIANQTQDITFIVEDVLPFPNALCLPLRDGTVAAPCRIQPGGRLWLLCLRAVREYEREDDIRVPNGMIVTTRCAKAIALWYHRRMSISLTGGTPHSYDGVYTHPAPP